MPRRRRFSEGRLIAQQHPHEIELAVKPELCQGARHVQPSGFDGAAVHLRKALRGSPVGEHVVAERTLGGRRPMGREALGQGAGARRPCQDQAYGGRRPVGAGIRHGRPRQAGPVRKRALGDGARACVRVLRPGCGALEVYRQAQRRRRLRSSRAEERELRAERPQHRLVERVASDRARVHDVEIGADLADLQVPHRVLGPRIEVLVAVRRVGLDQARIELGVEAESRGPEGLLVEAHAVDPGGHGTGMGIRGLKCAAEALRFEYGRVQLE